VHGTTILMYKVKKKLKKIDYGLVFLTFERLDNIILTNTIKLYPSRFIGMKSDKYLLKNENLYKSIDIAISGIIEKINFYQNYYNFIEVPLNTITYRLKTNDEEIPNSNIMEEVSLFSPYSNN